MARNLISVLQEWPKKCFSNREIERDQRGDRV